MCRLMPVFLSLTASFDHTHAIIYVLDNLEGSVDVGGLVKAL